jgi:hypothetical protein
MEWNGAVTGSFWNWTLFGIVGFLAVAVISYAAVPVWRCHRRGLVRLDVPVVGGMEMLGAPSLERHLARLRSAAGLPAHRVRFLLDPYNRRPGGVVFGAFGRYLVVLHAGLVVRRESAPAEFDAVVRHELNHIRNGDVDWTYVTITIWRSFLAVVFVPTVAVIAYSMFDIRSPAVGFPVWGDGLRKFAVLGALLAVVYLARADILRTRELHADIVPGLSRIDLPGWLSAARRRWPLLHNHPSAVERARALHDHSALFRATALPFVAAGAATTLAASSISLGLARLALLTWSYWTLVGLLLCVAAALIWNSVTYASEHGSRPTSGWREGVWLGAGLVLGDVMVLLDTPGSPLPQRPWMVAVPFAITLIVCVWIAQMARLCCRLVGARRWRVGLLWAAMAVTVVGFGGLCINYLRWWTSSGLDEYSAVIRGGGWSALPWPLTHWLPAATVLATDQMAVIGPVLLWLVTVAGWMWLSVRNRRRPSPPRRLLPLALGAVAGGLAMLTVAQAVMRRSHPWSADWSELDYTVYMGALTLAVIVSSAIVTALAAAIAPSPAVPYGVAAGGWAMLIGILEATTLVLADGCTGPLSLAGGGCPGPTPLTGSVPRPAATMGGPALAFGLIIVVAAAIVTTGCREVLARWRGRKPSMAPSLTVSGPPDHTGTRQPSRAATMLASTVSATLIGLAASITGPTVVNANAPGPITLEVESSSDIGDRTHAWLQAGGMAALFQISGKLGEVKADFESMLRVPKITEEMTAAEVYAVYHANTMIGREAVRDCRALEDSAIDAGRFIPPHDRRAKELWERILKQATILGPGCALIAESNQPVDLQGVTVATTSSNTIDLYDQLRKIGRMDQEAARASAPKVTVHPPPRFDPSQFPQRQYMRGLCRFFSEAWDKEQSRTGPIGSVSREMQGSLDDLARRGSAVQDEAKAVQKALKKRQDKIDWPPDTPPNLKVFSDLVMYGRWELTDLTVECLNKWT